MTPFWVAHLVLLSVAVPCLWVYGRYRGGRRFEAWLENMRDDEEQELGTL